MTHEDLIEIATGKQKFDFNTSAPEDCTQLLDFLSACANVKEKMFKAAKEYLSASKSNSIPHYSLSAPVQQAFISNTLDCHKAMTAHYNMTDEEFYSCISVTFKSLLEFVTDKTNATAREAKLAAEARLRDILKDCVDYKTRSGSLTRSKK